MTTKIKLAEDKLKNLENDLKMTVMKIKELKNNFLKRSTQKSVMD